MFPGSLQPQDLSPGRNPLDGYLGRLQRHERWDAKCGMVPRQADRTSVHVRQVLRGSGSQDRALFLRSSPQSALIVLYKLLDPLGREIVCDIEILPRLV